MPSAVNKPTGCHFHPRCPLATDLCKWNDPALATLNPGTKLPDMAITVVHRSDGSGTTYIFTDFLSNVSPAWKGFRPSRPGPICSGARTGVRSSAIFPSLSGRP